MDDVSKISLLSRHSYRQKIDTTAADGDTSDDMKDTIMSEDAIDLAVFSEYMLDETEDETEDIEENKFFGKVLSQVTCIMLAFSLQEISNWKNQNSTSGTW